MMICCDPIRYFVGLYEGLKSACRAYLWRYESWSAAREFSHIAYIIHGKFSEVNVSMPMVRYSRSMTALNLLDDHHS